MSSIICSLGATCGVLNNDNHELRIKYLLLQEILSWLVIWRMLAACLRFFVIVMLTKSGMPPLHGWLIRILDKTFSSLLWIIRVRKSRILLIMTWGVSKQHTNFLLLSLIITLILAMWVTEFEPLMIFSRGVNIIWAVIACSITLLFGWIFMLAYLFYLWRFFESQSRVGMIRWRSMLGLSALPPRVWFFFKALLVLTIGSGSFVLVMLFILRTIILFGAYLQWLDHHTHHTFAFFSSNAIGIRGILQLWCSWLLLSLQWSFSF